LEGGNGIYLFNMPQIDILATQTDYGVAFEKGKPLTNIAKIIEVTVDVEY